MRVRYKRDGPEIPLKKKPEDLVAEIRAYCEAHQEPKQAGKWARYFREGYDSWGLVHKDHPIWNEKQQEWLESYGGLGLRGFLKAGELLFQSRKYEEGALAIRFLKTRRDELDAQSVGKLAKWFEAGIQNWAHTDVLCGEAIAPLLESRRLRAPASAAASPRDLFLQAQFGTEAGYIAIRFAGLAFVPLDILEAP